MSLDTDWNYMQEIRPAEKSNGTYWTDCFSDALSCVYTFTEGVRWSMAIMNTATERPVSLTSPFINPNQADGIQQPKCLTKRKKENFLATSLG
jgi:hypothetical protein